MGIPWSVVIRVYYDFCNSLVIFKERHFLESSKNYVKYFNTYFFFNLTMLLNDISFFYTNFTILLDV